MGQWNGRWTPDGLRPRRETFWESTNGHVTAMIAVVAVSWALLHFFIEHQRAIEAKQAEMEANEAAATQQTQDQERQNAEQPQAQQQPSVRSFSDASNTVVEHRGGFVAPVPSAIPHRSPQQEYELASQIMESTSAENRREQAIANSGVLSNGQLVDQGALDESWLDMYEQHCLHFGKGSINYRHCRADFKQIIMNQCNQFPPGNQTAEQEAQCYAARSYQIVD